MEYVYEIKHEVCMRLIVNASNKNEAYRLGKKYFDEHPNERLFSFQTEDVREFDPLRDL